MLSIGEIGFSNFGIKFNLAAICIKNAVSRENSLQENRTRLNEGLY